MPSRPSAISLQVLDAGEVDLAVGVPPTISAGRISTRPFDEQFVCIVRKGHVAVERPLDLDAFVALTHLLVSPENDRFGHVVSALAKLDLKRRLALTLPHMYAEPTLVAQSELLATLMHGVVLASGRADDLCILVPPLELEAVSFVMSWHRRNDAHHAQRWFRDCIASLPGMIEAGPDDAPGHEAPQ